MIVADFFRFAGFRFRFCEKFLTQKNKNKLSKIIWELIGRANYELRLYKKDIMDPKHPKTCQDWSRIHHGQISEAQT